MLFRASLPRNTPHSRCLSYRRNGSHIRPHHLSLEIRPNNLLFCHLWLWPPSHRVWSTAVALFSNDRENLDLPVPVPQEEKLIGLFIQMAASVTAYFLRTSFLVPLFFQLARKVSAIKACVRLLRLIYLLISAITLNGALISKHSYCMP